MWTEVALKQNGEPIYVFRMICVPSGDSAESTLTLTRQEAQSRSARLAASAKDLALKLEAIMEGMPSGPKRRVNAKQNPRV